MHRAWFRERTNHRKREIARVGNWKETWIEGTRIYVICRHKIDFPIHLCQVFFLHSSSLQYSLFWAGWFLLFFKLSFPILFFVLHWASTLPFNQILKYVSKIYTLTKKRSVQKHPWIKWFYKIKMQIANRIWIRHW